LIFDRLFQNPMRNPIKRRQMHSLLDRVTDDARSLSRKAGMEDRRTLDQYLSVVRETEKRLGNIAATNGLNESATMERPTAPANLNEQVETMIDLIALALWTDSTRCVTYMLGNSNSRMVFDFLGIKEQHHYLSHFFRNFSRSNLDSLLKISLWHMQKFDYLLTRMKSLQDHNGTLLDHTLVLYGSGMGHSDNHTATRIPIVLAGGKGMLKTGRYVRYAKNQQLGRLHLTLLRKFGIESDIFGDSTESLPGLDGSDYEPYRERVFESWVKHDGGKITVQGRLRLSDNLNEAKVFFVDVDEATSVRVEVTFRDFHDFNLAYHCGTPIKLSGTGTDKAGQLLITKISDLRSLFGKKPGTQKG
jgi:hypothetical protein